MKTFIVFLLFLGTAFAQHVAASKVTVTDPGTFTNSQIHQYVTSFVGGISPDMYHSNQGFPGYTTEAGSFGVAVPSGAPIGEADALVGMVTSACNSANRTTCNAVAVSGHAAAFATGAAVWGQNTTVDDYITPGGSGLTSVNLTGNEIDIGVAGDQTLGWIHGIDVTLSGGPSGVMPSDPTRGAGLTIGSSSTLKWPVGLHFAVKSVTGPAIWIDTPCDSGSCGSSPIRFDSYNGSAVKSVNLQSDSLGNLEMTSNGTGVGITYPAYTLAQLQASSTPNFTVAGCSDCKNVADNSAVAGAACVGSGQGAIARKQNNRWDCN